LISPPSDSVFTAWSSTAFSAVAASGEGGDQHPEYAAVLSDGIDPCFDQAAVGSLIGRGFDLGVGGKGDREGVAGICVFHPALRGGRRGDGNQRGEEGDQAHFGPSEHDPEHCRFSEQIMRRVK
jgi:hypothetical protein